MRSYIYFMKKAYLSAVPIHFLQSVQLWMLNQISAVSTEHYSLHSEWCTFKDELQIMYFLPELVNETC